MPALHRMTGADVLLIAILACALYWVICGRGYHR